MTDPPTTGSSGGGIVRRGPVISTKLYDPQGLGLFEFTAKKIDRTFALNRDALASWFEEALRDSYMTGLRDGYAQGVADLLIGKSAYPAQYKYFAAAGR